MTTRDTHIADAPRIGPTSVRWLGILLVLMAACTFDSRDIADKNVCERDSDCLEGRLCVDEVCVDADEVQQSLAPPDAGLPDAR